MSYGIKSAGIDILAGIDIDKSSQSTYEVNIGKGKFIHKNIYDLSPKELQNYIEIEVNDPNLILVGCSPCQYWTVMRTKKDKDRQSSNLLREFLQFVLFYRPGYVLIENVPGILRKKKESQIESFINKLEKNGYQVEYKIVDLSEYGIPQTRKRFSLIANRLNIPIEFPQQCRKRYTVRDTIGDISQFPKIPAGHKDNTYFLHSVAGLTDINFQRLKLTPNDGGGRVSWEHTELQLRAYKSNNVNFKDTYSRMYWDQPAPTITTKFFNISNGRFVHPEQDRAISLREGAMLQTFPKNYRFIGNSIEGIARMIGNAVPPKYAKQLGKLIRENHE